MKIFALLAAVSTACLSAEPLTQGLRDRAMSHLHMTRKLFLDSVAGVSASQWSFRPAPDRWSIAECAEHITVVEDMLMGLARTGLSANAPVAGPEIRANDEKVLAAYADRSSKAQAPEPARPTGRFSSRDDVTAAFRQKRDANIAYVQTTQDDMRAHLVTNPNLKADPYQVILMMSAHTERHVKQILEVKSSAGYPVR